MNRPVRHLGRRQLLLGATGFTLGLPWLRSLLPREVEAQALPVERRFVALATNHGGIYETSMYPANSLLTQSRSVHSGHTVRSGALAAAVSDGERRLSDILRGPASLFTESLLSKMNVLRGLDIPFYIAHHTGGHLGNYARNDGNGTDGKSVQNLRMPTIDQLMAWSSNFYTNLAGVSERSLVFGSRRMSYNWSSPSDRSGDIQEVSGSDDPAVMFQRVFVPEEDPDAPAPRPPIVDRVFSSYQSLRQSDRRLSTDDRQRLDDHMDRLAELERKLTSTAARRASCGDAPEPGGNEDDPFQYYKMLNDVITAAFLCGTSRIAVIRVSEQDFVDFVGDWHQDVAHQWSDDGPQALLREANQSVFEHVMLDLASKLDVEEAPGQNVLSSSLIQWTQESGEATHEARSIPTITFGGASGALSTGLYCDYRRTTDAGMATQWGRDRGYTGLLYSQWLAQVLQAMGLQQSEFADIPHNGAAGYGLGFVDEVYEATHADGVVENAGDPLPFIG